MRNHIRAPKFKSPSKQKSNPNKVELPFMFAVPPTYQEDIYSTNTSSLYKNTDESSFNKEIKKLSKQTPNLIAKNPFKKTSQNPQKAILPHQKRTSSSSPLRESLKVTERNGLFPCGRPVSPPPQARNRCDSFSGLTSLSIEAEDEELQKIKAQYCKMLDEAGSIDFD